MGKYDIMVSMAGEGVVVSAGPIHPEESIEAGEVASPWNECHIPDCRHKPCPAKMRAWAWYGLRYVCRDEGCDHGDCAARRRADEDDQPFGVRYTGPALPQHTVTPDGKPLGAAMHAVKGSDGRWRLVPVDACPVEANRR